MPVEITKRVLETTTSGKKYWGKATYTVYSPEEAKAHGLNSISWRFAEKVGQWVHDEGGWTSKVIQIKTYLVGRRKKSAVTRVTLPYGRFYQNSRHSLDYSKYRNKPRKDWSLVEARKSRTKRMVKVYARMYLEKSGKLSEEDFHQLGLIYRADQKVPSASAKRVLRIEGVQTMVAKELAKLLSEQGISPKTILERYDLVYEGAVRASQYNVAKSILDKMSDMLDMRPDITRVHAGMEMLEEGEIEMPALEAQDQLPENIVPYAGKVTSIAEVDNGDDIEHGGWALDRGPSDGQA